MSEIYSGVMNENRKAGFSCACIQFIYSGPCVKVGELL